MSDLLLSLKHFDCEILAPLELTLRRAECICLSGPSGSGKTRLLRAIADLDRHGGTACLEGIEQREIAPAEWRRQVALLPAESAWWEATVAEHMAVPPSAEDLAELGLSAQALEWEVARLSSGERQRLALLRVLSRRPLVLLLDEPTANLDSDSGQRVERLLHRLRRDQGLAMLWVSHDAEQIRRVADRHLTIVDGELVEAT